ncbi:suppressor of fused domain protein [Bacillus sp. FJAT-28004]|uniref:suppressor of fused domain protein n=1 Tax=Bacillus sp. FJAT-28004 TaxID=1679165 RepID=UPI0006B54ABE|nr:suppressor of fused domain protein [Bacillus sp. FJAT-28004]
MGVSEDNKKIAQAALSAFEGKPKVFEYSDDNNESSIDILCSSNDMHNSLSFSTIGLSDFSVGYDYNEIPLRIELVGASQFECFANVLATCAFNIINSNYKCYPGIIFNDIVKMYLPNSPMRHILFVTPFLWEDSLKTMNFINRQVAWLMAVPISEAERIYADEHGSEALEELFEVKQISVFDLERSSTI